MRRTVGTTLMGLFGFFLVTALAGWFYAPGSTQRTPLNVDTTTHLTGTGTYLGNGPAPVKVVNHTVADGKKSDGSVVVFTATTCLVWATAPGECADGKSKDLINASSDLFAADRHTGEAVRQAKYTSAQDPHTGLINKFPFSASKQNYKFWDGLLGRTVDADFKRLESVNGFSTYRYEVNVPATTAEISDGVSGTYSDDKVMWADPVTGSIINQTEHQVRKLDSGDTALELDIAYTDAQVAQNIKDAQANGTKLRLVGILPNVAIVLAVLSLLGGLALLLGDAGDAVGRRGAGRRGSNADATPAAQ